MVIPSLASRAGLATLGTWHERRDGEFATNHTPDDYQRTAWGRFFGNSGRYGRGFWGTLADRVDSFHRHGPSYDFSLYGFQAGIDLRRREDDEGKRSIYGLYLAYVRAKADVFGMIDFGYGTKAGRTTMDAWSLGGYYTHVDPSGWYIDAVLQGTLYTSIRATSNHSEFQTLKTDGWGLLASLEAGHPFALNDDKDLFIEPQAQIVFQHLSFSNSADEFGLVSFKSSNAFYGRIAARLFRDWTNDDGLKRNAWGRASLWTSFGAQADTTFSNLSGQHPTTLGIDLGRNWAQFDLGVSMQMSERTSLFVVGQYNTSLSGARGHNWGGRIGIQYKFGRRDDSSNDEEVR